MIVCKNLIDGEWVLPSTPEVLESRNPATGELVCTAPSSRIEDVGAAVEGARKAFETTSWADDPSLRARILYQYAGEIRSRIEELAKLLTDENGKTLNDSRGELRRGSEIVEYYASLALNIHGKSAVTAPNFLSLLLREPLGVVAAIVPFNFPVVLMLRALAPALAAGNAVVVKPAEYTSGITYGLIRILAGIQGLPAGMVNLVSGGASVGAELVKSDRVDMVSFTGSTAVGKEVMRLAADSLKKVSLEMGGKSPNIVFRDANYRKAVQYALKGAWLSFGSQVCYAGTRILLEQEIHDQFVKTLKEEAEKMKLGYGAREGVDIGPVISRRQMERVLGYIEIGKQDAKLVTGGHRADQGELSKGFFIAPTVFDEVPLESRVSQEEIFGPVITIFPFKDVEEAARIANSTSFGLAGAVWTDDINKAFRLARRIKSGTVWINTYGRLPPQAEMAGHGQSGMGTQYGEEGLYEYTQFKHIGVEIEG
ncbi:MAG: aldehyde dehydrogenase [Acidobacteria bacterium]|nr:aldehyde dehydrogenase [Acidobacteriota bacterium]